MRKGEKASHCLKGAGQSMERERDRHDGHGGREGKLTLFWTPVCHWDDAGKLRVEGTNSDRLLF
jgi:hypothetical protein